MEVNGQDLNDDIFVMLRISKTYEKYGIYVMVVMMTMRIFVMLSKKDAFT